MADEITADPFDADDLDQPSYEGEARNYVICSTPRTGSSLLCELLKNAGVGVPMEYFHRRDYVPKMLSRYGLLGPDVPPVTVEDYIAALKRNRTTRNGWFGFKAHRGQYKWLIEQCNLDQCFPALKYIYVSRNDTIAQAVSASKAAQTKQWTSGQRKIDDPEYNEAHIDYCLHTIRKSNRYWRKLFEDQGIQPLHVIYEDLVADKREVLGEVLSYLGVENVSVPVFEVASTLERQFDAINREWIERYRSTHNIENGNPSR